MKVLLFFVITLLLSCELEKEKSANFISAVHFTSGGSSIEQFNTKAPKKFELSDPECSSGLSSLKEAEVYLAEANKSDKNILSQSIQKLSNVKANPLSSSFISSVIINKHIQTIKKDCEKAPRSNKIGCESYERKEISAGKKVHLCKTSYPEDSLENRILAAVISVQKTLECAAPFLPPQTSFPKINIEVFPKMETVFHMKDGTTKHSEETDNAYYSATNGIEQARIVFLANSKSHKSKEYILNLGVGSHETSHFIFAQFTPALLSLLNYHAGLKEKRPHTESPHKKEFVHKRVVNGKTVYNAMSEQFADEWAHFCLLQNPYSDMRLPDEGNIRDPEIAQIKVKKDSTSIIQDKIITIDMIRHFFSEKTTDAPLTSQNDKDIHHIGAYMLFSKLRYFEALGLTLPILEEPKVLISNNPNSNQPTRDNNRDSDRNNTSDSDGDNNGDSDRNKTGDSSADNNGESDGNKTGDSIGNNNGSSNNKTKNIKLTEEELLSNLNKAKTFSFEGLVNMGQTIPNKNPMVLLDDLYFAQLKPAMSYDSNSEEYHIEEAICDILKKYTPINYIGIQNKFSCRAN